MNAAKLLVKDILINKTAYPVLGIMWQESSLSMNMSLLNLEKVNIGCCQIMKSYNGLNQTKLKS